VDRSAVYRGTENGSGTGGGGSKSNKRGSAKGTTKRRLSLKKIRPITMIVPSEIDSGKPYVKRNAWKWGKREVRSDMVDLRIVVTSLKKGLAKEEFAEVCPLAEGRGDSRRES